MNSRGRLSGASNAELNLGLSSHKRWTNEWGPDKPLEGSNHIGSDGSPDLGNRDIDKLPFLMGRFKVENITKTGSGSMLYPVDNIDCMQSASDLSRLRIRRIVTGVDLARRLAPGSNHSGTPDRQIGKFVSSLSVSQKKSFAAEIKEHVATDYGDMLVPMNFETTDSDWGMIDRFINNYVDNSPEMFAIWFNGLLSLYEDYQPVFISNGTPVSQNSKSRRKTPSQQLGHQRPEFDVTTLNQLDARLRAAFGEQSSIRIGSNSVGSFTETVYVTAQSKEDKKGISKEVREIFRPIQIQSQSSIIQDQQLTMSLMTVWRSESRAEEWLLDEVAPMVSQLILTYAAHTAPAIQDTLDDIAMLKVSNGGVARDFRRELRAIVSLRFSAWLSECSPLVAGEIFQYATLHMLTRNMQSTKWNFYKRNAWGLR